jgi:hypothetical protein
MLGEPDPRHWRDRAKEARSKADQLKEDRRSERRMLGIADFYEHLAERIEQHAWLAFSKGQCRTMAKQAKKAKPSKRRGQERLGLVINIIPAPPPSEEDFNRARDLLRRRADALILDISKRYSASTASELTTVLDAMDSLAEFESMERSVTGALARP